MKINQGLLKAIKKAKSVAIFSHKNADGDALGSAAAFFYILKKLGKQSAIFLDEFSKDNYSYLRESKLVKDEFSGNYDLFVALDSSETERLGKFGEIYDAQTNTISIDHHRNSSIKSTYSYINTQVSSCAEQIYDVMRALKVKADKEIASMIYLGMLTDSGSFLYDNTTAKTFRIASELIEKGAEKEKLCYYNYQNSKLKVVNLTKIAYNNLVIDKQISYSHLTIEDFKKNNAIKDDVKGLPALISQIDGVQIAFFCFETKPNYYNISVRSYGKVSSSAVCEKLGGGGHLHASGCKIEGDLNTVIKIMLKECKRELKNAK